MDELMNELKHLGLAEKEASVYLASLELGPAAVQDISHKSKINRATTYVMIEALAARGLMSTFVKGKKRFYVAEGPDRLVSILHMQQKELEEKEKEFEKTLPMLLALYNADGAKPQIRYLEGLEGVKTARAIFEKLTGESLEIYPVEETHQSTELMEAREQHHANLRHQNTAFRVLAVMQEVNEDLLPHLGVGEFRIVSATEFPIHGSIVIRENYVFLFSHRASILSVVIISKEIADVARALFNLAWKGAKDFPSKKSSV